MIDEQLTNIFKALGHPIRRQILDFLKDGPRTTGELNNCFQDVTRFAVMKHLNLLEEASLILIRREGRTRLNFINVVPLQQMYDRWVSKYQASDVASILKLKQVAERRNEQMEQALKHDTFQIEQEVMIEADRQTVFTSLTKDINQWWAYRLFGQESILTLDPKVGGSFLEDAGNGEGAIWGTVTYVKAYEEIRLNGLLGMRGAVNSAYSFKLEEKGNSTLLKLSHTAAGLLDPNWKDMHSHGWEELLGSFLKNYVETGKLPEERQS
jgi:DNA-binding transcriptional ArsR family regulator